MNYLNQRATEIFKTAHPSTDVPSDLGVYRHYALLSFVKGKETTLEDVHDAWATWKCSIVDEHQYLVPFNELSHEVQEWDRWYAQAIWACSEHGRSAIGVAHRLESD